MKIPYPMLPLPLVSLEQLRGLEKGEWLIQPKADGWHVVIGERVWTRKGKDITDWIGLSPIRRLLPIVPPIDGELVLIAAPRALIPKLKSGYLPFLIYAFDLVMPGVPFEERLQALYKMDLPGWIVPMETYPVRSWDGVQSALRYYQALGFEGVVLKRADLPYRPGAVTSYPVPGMVKVK